MATGKMEHQKAWDLEAFDRLTGDGWIDEPEFYDYPRLSNDELRAPAGKFRAVVHDLVPRYPKSTNVIPGVIHYYHAGDFEALEEAKTRGRTWKVCSTRYVVYDDMGRGLFMRHGPVIEYDYDLGELPRWPRR